MQQFQDILHLRSLERQLSVSDYYDMRLYEPEKLSDGTIEDFFGWRMNSIIDDAFNQNYWRALANDKILNYNHLMSIGVPIPETVALFAPDGRTLPGSRVFQNANNFIKYLREEAEFPLFFKPNCGTYGRSSFAITGYDKAADFWQLSSGKQLHLEQLERILAFIPYKGIFLQKLLNSHKSVRAVVGNTVACLRMNVMRNGGKPFIFNAFWKIPTGNNMTDNFSGGKHGNLLSEVDIQSGLVGRTISGIGKNYCEIECHPDTNERLVGFQLPDFKKAVEMVCQGAKSLEGLNFQHWDVTFTNEGPVAMEVNLEPDLHIIQLLNRRGLYNSVMIKQLADVKAAEEAIRACVHLQSQRPELEL